MANNNPGSINPMVPQAMIDLNTGKPANSNKAADQLGGGNFADKVDISKKAKELSKALNAVNNMPDTRQDSINQAKQRLEQDNGQTPAPVISAKMLLED